MDIERIFARDFPVKSLNSVESGEPSQHHNSNQATPAKKSPAEKGQFGSWMLVTKSTRYRTLRKETSRNGQEEQYKSRRNFKKEGNSSMKSRYIALADLEEEIEEKADETAYTYKETADVSGRGKDVQTGTRKDFLSRYEKQNPRGSFYMKEKTKPGQKSKGKENKSPMGLTQPNKAQDKQGPKNPTSAETGMKSGSSMERNMNQRIHVVVKGNLSNLGPNSPNTSRLHAGSNPHTPQAEISHLGGCNDIDINPEPLDPMESDIALIPLDSIVGERARLLLTSKEVSMQLVPDEEIE